MSDDNNKREFEMLQAKFQIEVDKYTKLQKKYDKMVRSHGGLDTQLNENTMVKEELELAKDDSRVFKMVGDVLVPQTLEEARTTVNSRIEYIQKELKRNSEIIAESKTEMGTARETISSMEKDLQKMIAAQQKQDN